MSIPPYSELMLPVLQYSAQKPWKMRDLITRISDDLKLTTEERTLLLPGGSTTVIASRVHWAKTYLKQAGLVEQPSRGVAQVTRRGREVLKEKPKAIDSEFLQKFPEFQEFQKKSKIVVSDAETATASALAPVATATPVEQIGSASRVLEELLRESLLQKAFESSPSYFERIVLDLMLAMGYGGSRMEAAKQLGGSGDGGVDGVIQQDRLGLDLIFLQAKRYKPGNAISSEVVHAFVGALVSKGAQRGVFITTSSFSKAARAVANGSAMQRIILIDGDELTSLIIRFNVGVRIANVVEIKQIALDYFEPAEIE